MRQIASIVLKLVLAGAVLSWMVSSGKLDPARVAHVFSDWKRTAATLAIVYLQIGISSWRWLRLTHTLGFGLRFRQAFSLTMIGVLFTTIVPGSVGGDVIKAYYVGAHVPRRRADALTTILMDRYVGLVSLLGLATIGVVTNYATILSKRVLVVMAIFAVSAFVATVLALVAGVFISTRVGARIGRVPAKLPFHGAIVKALNALGEYRREPGAILTGILVSVPSHLLACGAIYLAITAIRTEAAPSLPTFLFLVPLGLITTVIPISPGGIGIGQAAMFTLFETATRGSGSTVSDAFTVYQTAQIAVYLTGFIPYLIIRKSEPDVVRASAA